MALLSGSMIEVIETNAISDELNPILATFKSKYPNVDGTDSPSSYENLLTHRSTCNPQSLLDLANAKKPGEIWLFDL